MGRETDGFERFEWFVEDWDFIFEDRQRELLREARESKDEDTIKRALVRVKTQINGLIDDFNGDIKRVEDSYEGKGDDNGD